MKERISAMRTMYAAILKKKPLVFIDSVDFAQATASGDVSYRIISFFHFRKRPCPFSEKIS